MLVVEEGDHIRGPEEVDDEEGMRAIRGLEEEVERS
jgi:hypothetical protein